MGISNENKVIAKSALQAFGGKPSVSKYWDDGKVSSIDLLSSANTPYDGITSYSTIGFSDYSIDYFVDEVPLRLEIVGVCATEYELFPNVLATSLFNIINSKQSCSPGTVFRGVVKMYYPNVEVEHVLFVPPFLWEEHLKNIDFPEKKVTWLLAIPISEKEYRFAKENGTDKLEDLFESNEIDIFNIERKSVL
ncbi:suppressor of fused domain protein [Paenibacillus qinlingensis]|uniref:Suppressor of fused-like domain-containing protein n=1 Tax=Paenibacillus qinlingensis TaxID=1837343 RepID=A0ABU1P155_9BACL|nr:suppressor of fused domain protein [Paenibacillus qinlingensis]MDR6553466.1 hypothetical protein [Paenibacillus qinlingensis]